VHQGGISERQENRGFPNRIEFLCALAHLRRATIYEFRCFLPLRCPTWKTHHSVQSAISPFPLNPAKQMNADKPCILTAPSKASIRNRRTIRIRYRIGHRKPPVLTFERVLPSFLGVGPSLKTCWLCAKTIPESEFGTDEFGFSVHTECNLVISRRKKAPSPPRQQNLSKIVVQPVVKQRGHNLFK
jgi:hypothetical protein